MMCKKPAARRGMMLAINPDVKVVAIAQNGALAVELANQHKPDIAIMDINMPEMDGLAAYEKMLETQPNLALYFHFSRKRQPDLAHRHVDWRA